MNTYQLQEFKNIVAQLNINDEFDNLEVEICSTCCANSSGSFGPYIPEKDL